MTRRSVNLWLKESITGTPLEFHARNIHARIVRGKHDKQTVRAMKRILTKTSNCVDVGCNWGIILRLITRLAPKGHHYAFEPIPELFQYLERHFPTVRVYGYALSDTKGEKTFQYMLNRPPCSGFKKVIHDEPAEEINVQTELLDNIIPPDIPIHFVKIDVEGAEFQVLKGSDKTITKHRPFIIFEHNLNALRHYDSRPEDVYSFLVSRCGMRVSLVERWLDGKAPFTEEEFSEQVNIWERGDFIAYP